MVAQIVAGAAILPATRAGSIAKWDDKDAIAIQVINNCSDNIISNVQSKITSHDAWEELIRMFESQDVVTKMFLKDNLQL
jgi:F420-0:gamma-glutamyl ligase